jgi:hypothetical protein
VHPRSSKACGRHIEIKSGNVLCYRFSNLAFVTAPSSAKHPMTCAREYVFTRKPRRSASSAARRLSSRIRRARRVPRSDMSWRTKTSGVYNSSNELMRIADTRARTPVPRSSLRRSGGSLMRKLKPWRSRYCGSSGTRFIAVEHRSEKSKIFVDVYQQPGT